MTNYTVFENNGNSVYTEFKNNEKIVVGDTIEYISNNQMGYEKYKVILNVNNIKDIILIQDYYGLYEEIDTEN